MATTADSNLNRLLWREVLMALLGENALDEPTPEAIYREAALKLAEDRGLDPEHVKDVMIAQQERVHDVFAEKRAERDGHDTDDAGPDAGGGD